MDDGQPKTINKILSFIFLGFNITFSLLIFNSIFKQTKSWINSLKIKLIILIILDSFEYILHIFDFNIFDKLYYEFLIKVLYSLQIYLFISIYQKLIEIMKLKKMQNVDNSFHSYQFAILSLLLIFSYHKLFHFNFNPIIIIFIQNIAIIIFVYIFYKSLYDPVELLLNKLHKKYVTKIQIIRNLKLILNLSLILILCKIVINIIFEIFVDKYYRDFLAMPLNVIIYLKYFDFTVLYLITRLLDELFSKSRRDDDSLDKLKANTDNN